MDAEERVWLLRHRRQRRANGKGGFGRLALRLGAGLIILVLSATCLLYTSDAADE